MNYGKSVEEVWTWRENLAKELEKVPYEKRAEYLNKKAEDVCTRYGVKCHIVTRHKTTHA